MFGALDDADSSHVVQSTPTIDHYLKLSLLTPPPMHHVRINSTAQRNASQRSERVNEFATPGVMNLLCRVGFAGGVLFLLWRVFPCCGGQGMWLGVSVLKPLGVQEERCTQCGLAIDQHGAHAWG